MPSDPWFGAIAYSVLPARRVGITLALGTALLLGTLVLGSEFFLQRTQQTALRAADTTLQNSALVVANTINRQLLQVDGALVSLPALFAAGGDQKGEIDPQLAQRLLRAFNFETFSFRDLMLVSPDGKLWAAARPRPRNQPLPLTPADAKLPSHPGAVAVEGPIYNPSTGDWSCTSRGPSACPGSAGCRRSRRCRYRPLWLCSHL